MPKQLTVKELREFLEKLDPNETIGICCSNSNTKDTQALGYATGVTCFASTPCLLFKDTRKPVCFAPGKGAYPLCTADKGTLNCMFCDLYEDRVGEDE
jgi:hypothetical protein